MTTKTLTTMVDDIDGSAEDVVTCAFGLGDSHFEIELNAAHREEIESVLERFIAAARPIHKTKPTRRRRPVATHRTDRDLTHSIRQWAKDNGHDVSERGRISNAIVEAFKAAH